MATITANGSKGHHKFTLEVTESNYSVNNNTSDVSFTFKIAPIQSGYNWSGWGSYISYTITIDGTNYTGTIGSYNGSSTVTLKSDSKTGILHNNDGAKTIDFSFSVTDTSGQTYTCGNASKSGTLTLTTIPRASNIGVADANIGSSTNITINKASSGFTTTLWYKAQGQNSWTKIVDKTALQVYAWTVPTSFYSIIPSAKTMTCQFYADTYNGNTLVGSSSTVTATFTATGNPTISSIVAKDINATTIALTGNDETMVKYASNVRVTVTASGQNSATISSIKINNVTATGGVVTFNGATTNTYQVVVTDSRGYTTSQTITMLGANYIPLTINQTISRNQPTDNKINITASGNYYPGTFGATLNSLTVEYRYKERSSATWENWTNLVVTISGNTYSGNTQLSNMDYTKIYDFEIRALDKVYPNGEKTITGITVSKGTPVFNWDDDEFNVNVASNLKDTNINGNNTISGTLTLDGTTMNNYLCKVKTNVDLNTFTTPGMYYFTTGCSNVPAGYVFVIVMGDGTDVVQLAYRIGKEQSYYRKKTGGTWSSWSASMYSSYLGNNPDINSLKEVSGVYGIYGCTQAPETSIGVLEVIRYSNDWVVQRFSKVGTENAVWERCYYSGTTWSSWKIISSIKEGNITCTKASGSSNMTSAYYYQDGNVVTLHFTFKTTAQVNVGSNAWSGTISGPPRPKRRVTGTGYFSSSALSVGLYGSTEENTGLMNIRVLGANLGASNECFVSVTYVTN